MSYITVDGVRRPMTVEEIAAETGRDERDIAEHRERRREQFRRLAGARIAAPFAAEPDSIRLMQKQANAHRKATELLDAERTRELTTEEQQFLAQARQLSAFIDAVRDAENAASAALTAAGTDGTLSVTVRMEAIDAVPEPEWPA